MANYGPPGANRPEPWHEPPDESYPWRGGHRPGDDPPGAGGYPGAGRRPADDGRPGSGDQFRDDRRPWGDEWGNGRPQEPWQHGRQQGPGRPWHDGPWQEPWHDGRQQAPGRPWADGPVPAGTYPGGEPAYLGDGPDRYAPQPADRPRRSGGRGRTVAVLAVLVLLVLGGGAALFQLTRADEADPPPVTAPSPVTATPSGPPAGQPDGAADVSPSALAPESSADPRFAKAGQCVRNDGPAGGRPKLLISTCAPKTYEVLRRFDGATSGEKDAEAKCADVTGYTDWYFYNSELDTLDFVLCLKLR
ncbi:flagellar basal body protein FliL [Micromonospora sp. NPDC023956]|uniref:LppU/SCO3897 family protein n=1 Tax=Micromonospora sp. NPDC023956 TaxID=3155722 RepID=UPI0033CEC961